jgi:heme-degrading monooxygenase HmoA
MFARVIELKTEPGKAREVCAKIHERVLSALRAQPGFVDEIVLTSPSEGILALSLWRTREDAERYSRERYAQITQLIEHQAHSLPRVHTFDVETSTVHNISRGKAA